MANGKRLFVFDWDGTLCDSADKIIAAMHSAADELKLPQLTDDCIREIIGLGLPIAIDRLYSGLDRKQNALMCDAYSRHFVAADASPCSLFPHAETTLAALIDSGHEIAVATGKTRKGLDRMLRIQGMTTLFHSTRCADETLSKPNPLMLNELLAERHFSADKAFMIGDTTFDMEMGQRAGVANVAVDYGAHHIDRLKAFSPVLSVSNLKQLLTLI